MGGILSGCRPSSELVMAAGVLEGLRSIGLSVPEDVSVVGYDDVSWAGLTSPPLTTVRQSISLLSQSAVRTVLGSGEGSRRPARTELAIAPQLVVRRTTAAAPSVRGGPPYRG